ncbi:MAG: proline hydroxylase [Ponticaulis sp.]|nr:proline hydroxylase [Ponticaulis sp.]|tara:strand:- start:48974 stop:49669 length:696 start_codon:yes stop_codon:yes gene_type:complete
MTDTDPSSEDLLTQLDQNGFARMPGLVSAAACDELIGHYGEDDRYRSTISMQRYSFGRGEYRYFAYPLPDLVGDLRSQIYPRLAGVANVWAERAGKPADWPLDHEALLARCHEAGQARPTPLILRYGPGDYNCLHQDLYGEVHFPLQVIVGLSDPANDYEGGELVLVEQRPRMQSIPRVIVPQKGEGIVIPVRERPVEGKRGWYHTQMRHGVNEVRNGERFTLGLIFHDAS